MGACNSSNSTVVRKQTLADRKESGLDDTLDSLTGLGAMGYQKAPRQSLIKILTPAYSHDSDDSDRESIKSDDHLLMQEANAHIFEKVDEGSLKTMSLPFDGNWLVDMPSTPEESTRKRLNSASSFNSTPDGVSRRKSLDGEGDGDSMNERKDGDDQFVSPTKRLSLHFDKQWSNSLSTIKGGGSSDAESMSSPRPNTRKEILFISLNKLHYDFSERKDREDFPTLEKDAELLENILDNDEFDRQSTFMIFVSRSSPPLSTTSSSDNTTSHSTTNNLGSKESKAEFQILMNALDMAWKRYAPHMSTAYVYLDTFCDNREDFKLQDIMQLCDCVLTPIHEPKPVPPSSPRQRSGSTTRLLDVQLDGLEGANSTWSYIDDPSYSKPNILAQYCDYQSKPFIGSYQKTNPEKDPEAYMNQLWPRLTMLACASVPLMETRDELYQAVPSGTMVDNPDGTQSPAPKTVEERVSYRAKKFKFELEMACLHQLRPHFVYGSKEDNGSRLLLQLPFMSAAWKDKYDPLNGHVVTLTERTYAKQLLQSLTYKKESQLKYYRGAYDKDGKKHGYGVYISKKDGSVYEGTWSHDLQHGTNCKLTLSNDEGVIEADYVDGSISSFVTYTNFEGQVYYGEMNSAYQRHGNGRLQYVNGDYYEGAFERNIRHGKGRIVFTEGDEFIGYFLNDKANAFGTYNHADGGSFEGYYRNNRRHGEGTFISSDGSVTTCVFENGKKQGESVTLYADGTKFVCSFVEGRPESGKHSYSQVGEDDSFVADNRGLDTPPPKRQQQD